MGRELYEAEFEDLVFAAKPVSILDIGCGEGGFLRRTLARGIRATGVDANSERVAKTKQEGLDTHEATAHALPFAGDSFDWAVCERSAHHFADLSASFAEILRVARNLAVFDPWYDESIASQKSGADLDRWMKRVHRASGHENHGPLTAGDFVWALPGSAVFDVSVTYRVNLEPCGLEEAAADAERTLAHNATPDLFSGELETLLTAAKSTGLTGNGFILFFAHRAS